MLRSLLFLALCLSLGACVAPPSSSEGSPGRMSAESGTPGRVTLLDYRTSNRLTLLNEAHTDPVALYTEKRSSASTKVTSNEIFRAMLGHFEDQGFSGVAVAGYAPAVSDGSVRSALEMESNGAVHHIVLDTSNTPHSYKVLSDCRQAFLQIYNRTEQHQAIVNQGGRHLFDDQQRQLLEHAKSTQTKK